jgi:hypothetical protein
LITVFPKAIGEVERPHPDSEQSAVGVQIVVIFQTQVYISVQGWFPMRMIFLALFALVGTLGGASAQVPSRPLTVCEVFRNLSAYRGKVVEVRGAWNGGELWGDCAETSFGEGMWPAIVLDPSSARDFDKETAIVNRLSKTRGTRPIVTVVGRLDVPDPAELTAGTSYVYGAYIEPTQIKNITSEKIVPINKGRPMTVCNALENRETYKGKFVEIRGRFYGDSIGDKCKPLRTERFEWPSILEIAFPEVSIDELDPPATWSMDHNWYNKMSGVDNVTVSFVGIDEKNAS